MSSRSVNALPILRSAKSGNSRSVCIIGAGPSGLVAAKNLLGPFAAGAFDVTVFDAQPRVGGLWPTSKDDGSGLMHPGMVANQSRHTMHFSDFAWPDEALQFPRAWQVGQYLERYRDRYCQDVEWRLGHRVERAEPVEEVEGESKHAWRVLSRAGDGQTKEQIFDYLVVASGYFGTPSIPAHLQSTEHTVPVLHSSKYRDLESLLKDAPSSGKILVVGGQMSGIEIAGTIATHLSTARNSPDPASVDGSKYTLLHLAQRPTWVMPLTMTPKPTTSAPPFLPLDLSSYNRSNRPSPLVNTQGHITQEAARIVHGIFKRSLGTDQSCFSPDVAIKQEDFDDPPFLAVSDWYLEFVRSGDIKVLHGKLDSLHQRTAITDKETIEDVAAVILATGFDASSSLAFLPDTVCETLSTAPGDLNNTVALAFHGTYHPQVPNLGFVGFYRSPYWGVMESQARVLAALWQPEKSPMLTSALSKDNSIDRTLALRGDARASQFPMGDYLWLMHELNEPFEAAVSASGEYPRLQSGGPAMDIITPSRYLDPITTSEGLKETRRAQNSTLDTTWHGLRDAGFVPRAVFRSLLGTWKLERDITSRLPSHPSGHFSGTAKFLLRKGTKDGREAQFKRSEESGDAGLEYLYVEDGEFRADNGLVFRATRRYIWRYHEPTDTLSVWFAKTDEPKRADYLFHEIDFKAPLERKKEGKRDAWEAVAGHLCIEDFYDVTYKFKFAAVNLTDWSLSYNVNGPQKDYTIAGHYSR